jgi:hypothetical protein
VVSLILIVVGWVIVLLSILGAGVSLSIGPLDTLMTGVLLILAGLSLRGMTRSLFRL